MRSRLGLSQQQFAARLEVSKLTVLRWEHGRARPSPDRWRRLQRLATVEAPATDRPRDPDPSSAVASSNLPLQLTSFIGRERVLADIVTLLNTARLVTLTGPGGCGKTRLALAVAAERLALHPGGVRLVELGGLADAGLVAQAVAAALGVREEPGRPLVETVTAFLQPRQTLIVLDNCEHLLAGCAQLVVALLQACPALTVLATSRETLAVGGEVVWQVPPLDVPAAGALPGGTEAGSVAAIELFVERAQSRRAGFRLTEQNLPAVGEICVRLDGLPLAIELAAALVSLFSAQQIAERLDDRFRLLVGGPRGAPPRQQSLLATIAWSYELLGAGEQALFRALSAFAGSFDLAAVESIGVRGMLAAAGAETLLGQLIEKSLVVMEERDGAARFVLLDSLRVFGRDLLQQKGETSAILDRCSAHYLALAEALIEGAEGPEQPVRLRLLEREQDNIRAALAWYAEQGRSEPYLRLAAANSFYWLRRGALSEGRQWLAPIKVERSRVDPSVRARALHALGQVAQQQGDLDEAETCFRGSLELYRELADQRMAGLLLNGLGRVAGDRGDSQTQLECLRESAAVLREAGVFAQAALPLINLGLEFMNRQDFAAARDLLEEALLICREGRDPRTTGTCLSNLGALHLFERRITEAAACYEEALALRRELGDPIGMGVALSGLAIVARFEGDYGTARARLVEALTLVWEAGQRPQVIDVLELMLYVSAAMGAFEYVARLIGSTEAQRASTGLRRHQGLQNDYDRACDAAATALGAPLFASLKRAGAALSLEAVVAYATAVSSPAEVGAAPSAVPSSTRPAGLTERELAVVQLLAAGSSNKEIARELHLSVRTVERHITNAYSRIGVRGRADAIRFALEHLSQADSCPSL